MSYTFRPFKLVKVKYGDKTNLPQPRSGHRIVCNKKDIYCFGGFNPNLPSARGRVQRSFSIFSEFWKFNFVESKWKLLLGPDDQMPEELASNAMLMEGNALMIYGGTIFPFGTRCSNRLHVYWVTKDTNGIEQINASGDLPPALYGQAMICHGKFLYVVGGTTGYDYSCDIYRLDLQTKQWECVYICREDIRQDPKGRYRHEIAYDGKCIYVFGGGTSVTAFDLIEIPAFNLELNTWSFIRTEPDEGIPSPGYPGARKCHSCIQFDGDDGVEVVIAGGYDESVYFKDIWKLNLKTRKWKKFKATNLPQPLYFHDAATFNGCMYIFGGIQYKSGSFKRTNDLYKMWVTIPKLSTICWDAIINLCPQVKNLSRDELLKLGIPLQFITQLQSSS